jgi:replicative DNA helicase
MSAAKFPFDREFQIGILALMAQRYDFMLTAVELLEPDYFEDKILVWFYQTMRDYYLNHQEQPVVKPVVQNELRKAAVAKKIKPQEVKEYADIANEMLKPVNAQNYVINEVVRFCRRQAGRKVYLETAPLMDTADEDTWDDIIDRITAAASIGNNHLDLGINYFATVSERVRSRYAGDQRTVVPTAITPLDYKLNGGLKSGQLGIWMGGTGGGKSIALPHCGKAAVCHGFKVAHYTLELNEQDVADRYDASWGDVPFQDLRAHGKNLISRLGNLAQGPGVPNGPYADSLMIKDYPTGTASVNTIKSHLKQLASSGWVPDMLIVDYGDLLRPLTSYNDEYADLGAIFRDLRGLAGIYDIPVWTATQVNRAGLNAEVVDIEHIGDSLKKAQIADVIVAICSTREEREQNILRLFGAKNRNGPGKFVIEIKSNFEKMVFYSKMETDRHNAAQGSHQQQQQQGGPPAMPSPAQVKKSRRQGTPVT